MSELHFASQVATRDLDVYVDRVLDAIGFPGALVTDESSVTDFLEVGGEPYRMRRGGLWSKQPWEERPGDPAIRAANEALLAHASEKLGVPVGPHDRIVAIARAVRERERALPA
jgi:hypothetical protein